MKTTAAATATSNVFDRRFVAAFSVLAFLVVMVYLFLVTFYPVSSSGAKYADMIVPLLLGTVIGGLFGYIYGASRNNPPPHEATYPQAKTVTLSTTSTTGGADDAGTTSVTKTTRSDS